MNEARIVSEYGNRLMGYRALVNGKHAIAHMKNGKVDGYTLYEDLCRQILNGPCIELEPEKENEGA